MLPKLVMEKVWKKPGQGVVRINFDTTTNGRKMCFGLVARDHDGFVLCSRAGVLEKNVKPNGLNCMHWKKVALVCCTLLQLYVSVLLHVLIGCDPAYNVDTNVALRERS
ncbi:hypothetical protein J1N35_034424 [Gossypium stocksii]|uniref:RNase H type-1 domain-containing protein n=1 Tax=Gossypium stocksii TaxID=47602 RepID=A0A9D3UTW9_9ROSI|nr:hypothetical protein J1N35_034424 [Gossypium stocksii]